MSSSSVCVLFADVCGVCVSLASSRSRMVKKFDRFEKSSLAASTSPFALPFSSASIRPTIQLPLTRSTKRNRMVWVRMLAYITGTVDQELMLRNEYLAAENRILKAQIKGRMLLSDAEKATLAEIAHRLGRKALEELAAVAKPDTLLAWYRKLIANKFDGSKYRKSWGRPRVDEETERLVVRMAKR